MPHSTHQLKHLLRAAFLALPLLLLLSLNGRTVTLRCPVPAAGTRLGEATRGTVIKQRVMLEASAPLTHYVAPAALAWLPATQPQHWLPRFVRRAVAAAPLAAPTTFVAQLCRQRLLGTVLAPQAP